ncbi:hypothetical protein Cni_G13766 [Canna indica]|uniref:Uncharacterized protein n=1 Tax=Canna indica TaxID=4628 RepID=A0AAQ3KA51_9LILI|nr:hypothetical protein Cni_G13766 [Canna indica]
MGNEMGNQNVTGIQAQDTTATNAINGYLEHDTHVLKHMLINENLMVMTASRDADYPKDGGGKDLLEEDDKMRSDFLEKPPEDENLNKKHASEQAEGEKRNSVVLKPLPENEENVIPSVDQKNGDEEEQSIVTCDDFSSGGLIMENMVNDINVLGSNTAGNKLESKSSGTDKNHEVIISNVNQVLENELREERVPMENYEPNENDRRDGEENLAKTDTYDGILQREKSSSTESIETIFMDAIDAEIKSLLKEDDHQKTIVESPETADPDGHSDILDVISDEFMKGKVDDVKTNEQLAQPSEIKMTETEDEKTQENNLISMPKEGLVEEEDGGEVKELTNTPITQIIQEEDVEYRCERQDMEYKVVDNGDVSEESSFEFPLCLYNTAETVIKEVVMVKEAVVVEEEITHERKIPNGGLGIEANISKDNVVNIEGSISLEFPQKVDALSVDVVKKREEKNTEERTEIVDQKFGDQIMEFEDETTYEKEDTFEINLEETKSQSMSVEGQPDPKFNDVEASHDYWEEGQKKENTEKSEMANQNVPSSYSHGSEFLEIYSELPNLAQTQPLEELEQEETAEVSEVENYKEQSSSSHASKCRDIKSDLPNLIAEAHVNNSQHIMETQEILKAKNNGEKILNPVVEYEYKKQECVHESAGIELEASQNSIPTIIAESNQEKLQPWTANNVIKGCCFEETSTETNRLNHVKSDKDKSFVPKSSSDQETAAVMLKSNDEEVNQSPLKMKENPKDSGHTVVKRSDLGKPATPLVNLMKEEEDHVNGVSPPQTQPTAATTTNSGRSLRRSHRRPSATHHHHPPPLATQHAIPKGRGAAALDCSRFLHAKWRHLAGHRLAGCHLVKHRLVGRRPTEPSRANHGLVRPRHLRCA